MGVLFKWKNKINSKDENRRIRRKVRNRVTENTQKEV